MSLTAVSQACIKEQSLKPNEGNIVKNPLQAVELIGTIDEKGQLHLDAPITAIGQGRVRVILLPAETGMEEHKWLKAAAGNPAFDFLKDPAEDIYTLDDGQPFHDQRKEVPTVMKNSDDKDTPRVVRKPVVHVTSRGRMYVDPKEQLRTDAAQAIIKRAAEIWRSLQRSKSS